MNLSPYANIKPLQIDQPSAAASSGCGRDEAGFRDFY
jgi:hypothetical protein